MSAQTEVVDSDGMRAREVEAEEIGLNDGMKSTIVVEDLFKSYGEIEVLKGVDVEIGRGEFYALMGRNGSGKTTLISIITCTSLPTRGSAKILGYDVVGEADEVKRLIGYVPQRAREGPEEMIPRMVRVIDGIGCQAKRVETRAPSLEDVFFKVTSKPLRS